MKADILESTVKVSQRLHGYNRYSIPILDMGFYLIIAIVASSGALTF